MSMLVLKGWTRDRAGSVRLRSADPRDVPDIRMRYFDEGSPGWERDLDGVVDGLEMARTIVGSIENTKVVREL
ncbi:glucose-methanol-choline oxidoreductase, partial [Mycobacterium tuberculosis]|nr:glucose-methanol-choline oxidoreductase [Mycobacterium tuberculosis]